jgi:hypothetical protein
VALSVKTVLRASFVAPPEERFGARPAPPSKPPTATREGIVFAEFGGGAHWLSEREIDPRFELTGMVWFPTARRVGLGLGVSAGPGLRIDTAHFRGRYSEIVVGAETRFRLVHLPRFSTVVALGGALHRATLEGTLTRDSLDRDVLRWNPSVDFQALVDFRLSSAFYLGVAIGAAYFPTYRRYLVSGDPVFAPWPVAPNLTGYCGVELF